MFLVALAAQLSAPVAVHFHNWFSPYDCPAWLRPGVWEAQVRVVVDPDGRIAHCEPDSGKSNRQLGDYTCSLIIKRGKFKPATWRDGSKTMGVFRSSVLWVKPQLYTRPPPPSTDVQVTLDDVPRGLRLPYVIDAMVAVEADGKLSGCAIDPNESQRAAALFPVACARLLQTYKPAPVLLEGKAVRSVQVARARFDAN